MYACLSYLIQCKLSEQYEQAVLSKTCFLLNVFLNAHAELVDLCLSAAIVIKQSINQFEQSTIKLLTT